MLEGEACSVKFISGEIVAVPMKGNLVVLDENLQILKKFDGTDKDPQSVCGNAKYIGFGDGVGVVRYYERDGDKKPQV